MKETLARKLLRLSLSLSSISHPFTPFSTFLVRPWWNLRTRSTPPFFSLGSLVFPISEFSLVLQNLDQPLRDEGSNPGIPGSREVQPVVPDFFPLIFGQGMVGNLGVEVECESRMVNKQWEVYRSIDGLSVASNGDIVLYLHVLTGIVPDGLVQLISPGIQTRNLSRAFRHGHDQDASWVWERDIGHGSDGWMDFLRRLSLAEIVGSAQEDDPIVWQVLCQWMIVF